MKRAAVGLAIVMAFLLGLVIGGTGDQRDWQEPEDRGRNVSATEIAGADAAAVETEEPVKRKRVHVDPERAVESLQASANDAKGELRGGRVTLFSRQKYDDYERATFSFEHGVRDDPGRALVGNDWELSYPGHEDQLRVRMAGDDASTIQDLGAFATWAAALRDVSALVDAPSEKATAVEGHVYLVHTVDGNSDHMSLFRIVELASLDRVTLEWMLWTPARPAGVVELGLSAATRRQVGNFLDGVRTARIAARRETVGDIADPADILLQLRTGAQGGNRSSITLGDPGSWRRVGRRVPVLSEPFDVTEILERGALPRVFVRGGFIPEGMALVVESVDVYADAQGDSNGNGLAVAHVGATRVVRLGDGEGPVIDWLDGRQVLRPGDEHKVRLEVANSSAVALRLRGRFVPLAEAADIEDVTLWAKAAPTGAERVIADLAKVRSSYLAAPRAVLQVRADHGGGNPNRVSLLGKASGYLDRVVDEPLPPGVENLRDSVGYVDGGRIPRGHAFVITRITYRCRTTKESHGDAFVSVMGERIAGVERGKGPATVESVWVGRIAVPAGSEKRVFVEAAYFSEVDATFEGELIGTGAR